MTINNSGDNDSRSLSPPHRASGTVTAGKYPKGFVGGVPTSFMVCVNLSQPRDEARARKLLPGVVDRPVNEEARKAIEAARGAEREAMGLPAVRPGIVDTGVSTMSDAFPAGVPSFGFGSLYGRLAQKGYRLTEAYFQKGGTTNGRYRPPRLCLVFDGPTSPFGGLPSLSEEVRDQISDFLGGEVFVKGHVWDNTAAAAGTIVVNCCLTPDSAEREVRFTATWSVIVVEL